MNCGERDEEMIDHRSYNIIHNLSIISKTSAMVSSGFQMQETFETMRTQAKWFYCF